MMVVLTGVVVVSFLGLYVWYRRKLDTISKDLTLLKKEKEYFSEAVMVVSDKYQILYANKTTKSLFGLDESYKIKPDAASVELKIANAYPDDFFKVLKVQVAKQKAMFQLENVLLLIDGEMKHVNIFVDSSEWSGEKTISCVIDMKPVVQRASKPLENQNVSIDYLTGLSSQFLALSEINTLALESQKKANTFTLFLLGIDHFHDLQTTLGLGYTNRILKNMGHYFTQNPQTNMKVYRMDGDKFLILLKDFKSENEIRKRARDIMVSVGNIYRDNNDIRLTCSVGIVSYPKDGMNANKLIDNGYIALDKAQLKSESNIVLFNNEYQIVRADEVKMNEEIIKGLKKNEFLLHYQPIFDLNGERIIGAEALIRWKHPEHGLISADKFLHIAEKTGLIIELGEYVFNEAIAQRKHCTVHQNPNFKITINLSLKEMQVTALIPRLERLFDKYKIDRDSINIDVAESTAMEHIDKTLNDFKLLNDFGISLSLEHFGAGISSFKYLALLPIDTIKIDRSLIFDLTLNLTHQKTVKAMIDMAHTFDYKVVAEGVETTEEASILTKLQCDYAQGYLYSRPLPKEEFEQLLKSQ